MNITRLYAAGAAALGMTGLAFGDFALQWQPLPESLPLRGPLAWLSGALLIAGGVASVGKRTAHLGVALLRGFYGVWVLALHLPRVVAAPGVIAMWLGFCEILALAVAGGVAWLLLRKPARERAIPLRNAQLVFGACLLLFGASHFTYPAFTASMVPGWIPFPLAWAYLTGAAHIAAGVSLICGTAMRHALTWLAVMFASFVVLLHVPRVIAGPGIHAEWVMLAVATSLTGATLIMRESVTLAASAVIPLRNSEIV